MHAKLTERRNTFHHIIKSTFWTSIDRIHRFNRSLWAQVCEEQVMRSGGGVAPQQHSANDWVFRLPEEARTRNKNPGRGTLSHLDSSHTHTHTHKLPNTHTLTRRPTQGIIRPSLGKDDRLGLISYLVLEDRWVICKVNKQQILCVQLLVSVTKNCHLNI